MAQDWSVHAVVYFCSAVGDLLGAFLHWHLDLESFNMNKEDIIRMAREAGVLSGYESDLFQRFAALVADAEREACAKVVDHILKEGGGTWGDAIRARGQA
jgi:hypothetical protein